MRTLSMEKEEDILHAATEIFAEKGYYQTSIQSITQKAGVSTGTFYTYFKNKEEVLLAIYRKFSARLSDTLAEKNADTYPDSTEKLIVCTAAIIQMYAENPPLSLILLTKIIGMSKLSEQEYYTVFYRVSQVFEEMLSETGQTVFPDYYLAAVAYLQLLNSLTTQWLTDPAGRSLSELAEMILTYNFNALKLDTGKIRDTIHSVLEGEDVYAPQI